MANHGANNSAVRWQWQSWRWMRQKDLAAALGNWVRVWRATRTWSSNRSLPAWGHSRASPATTTETGEAEAKSRRRNTKLLGTDAQIT